jgi:HAUS augmin-like complex subunit 5
MALLANRLKQWSEEELGYRPVGRHVGKPTPSVNELQQVCRGSLVPILQFLVHQVKSEREVRHIRQNLHLHGSLLPEDHKAAAAASTTKNNRRSASTTSKVAKTGYCHPKQRHQASTASSTNNHKRMLQRLDSKVEAELCKRSELASRNEQLQAQLRELGQSAEAVDHDISVLRCQLRTKAEEKQQCIQQQQEADSRGVMYTTYAHTIQDKLDMLLEFERRLQLTSPVLSTSSCDTLSSSSDQTDYNEQMEYFKANFQPAELVRSLTHISEITRQRMKQQTESLDLSYDASKLHAEVNHTRNGSNNTLHHVMDLMTQRHDDHIASFLQTEKAACAEEMVLERLEDLLVSHRKDDSDCTDAVSTKITNIRALQDAEMHVKGLESAVKFLQETQMQLEQAKASRTGREHPLKSKQQNIQDMEQQRHDNEKRMQILTEECTNTWHENAAQQARVSAFARSQLEPLLTEFRGMCRRTNGSSLREYRSVVRIPVCPYASKQVSDQYSHQVVPWRRMMLSENPHQQHTMCSVFEAVGLDAQTAAVDLLPDAISQNEQQAMCALMRQNLLEKACAQVQSSSLHQVDTLVSAIQAAELRQMSSWLPQFDEADRIAGKLDAEIDNVSDLVNEWWEQPGQYSAPDLQIHGKNVQQYVSEWRSLLMQLSNSHSS